MLARMDLTIVNFLSLPRMVHTWLSSCWRRAMRWVTQWAEAGWWGRSDTVASCFLSCRPPVCVFHWNSDNKSKSGEECAAWLVTLPAHCAIYLLVSTGGFPCSLVFNCFARFPHSQIKQQPVYAKSYNIIRVNLWCNVLHKKSHSWWSHLIWKLHRAIKTKLIFGKPEWKTYI